MTFSINDKVFELFPDLIVGVVVAKNIDNKEYDPEIGKSLTRQEEFLPQVILGELADEPKIAVWREAYRKFGAKPKNYPPSLEALVKRILKGSTLPRINKLVDIYNTISLKYLVPAGGEDLDKTKDNIELTVASGDEEFIAIGDNESRPPKPGEIIYKDSAGVICRRFNWRESERCKFTEDTKNAILIIEGLAPTNRKDITEAVISLNKKIIEYCKGQTETHLLDKDNKIIEL